MVCIFCNASEDFSEEHIIPESLGGSIIARNVCRRCNRVLGSQVDAELTEHRNIYDAYKQLGPNDFDLSFQFMDLSLSLPNGNKTKMPKRSDDAKIPVNRIGQDKFVVDENNSDFVKKYIRSKSKDKNLSLPETRRAISDYMEWAKRKEPSIYEDNVVELKIGLEKGEGLHNNIMNAKTPSRFIANSCAEFSNLFGIGSKVTNIAEIKKYARYNGEKGLLEFFQEIGANVKALPLHLIRFTESQYIITFFAQVSFAVEILWNSDVQKLSFVNDIEKKKLFYAVEETGNLRLTNKEFDRWNATVG